MSGGGPSSPPWPTVPPSTGGLTGEAPGAGGPAAEGRVVGVDLGSRRIGVAVSDDRRTVASAYTVLQRSGSVPADHLRLAAVVAETGANLVVVGLPLSLSGAVGPAAQAVKAEVGDIGKVVGVPVAYCDERYSTVIAQRALAAGGRRPALRRAVVDKVAAAAILQTWLDRQRWAVAGGPRPGPASIPR
jgi:putative pre-16S rRNA nuclease